MSSNTDFKIAVCIRTRNRKHLFPWVKRLVEAQTIGMDKIHIIIVDGAEEDREVWSTWGAPNLHYIRAPNIILGASNNLSIQLAQELGCSYIALWDDDDWYAPEYLEKAVEVLEKGDVNIVGQSLITVYYRNLKEVWEMGPYGANHALEPTLVFRTSWSVGKYFDEDDRLGRGAPFLNDFTEALGRYPSGLYIHVAHDKNTFDKHRIIENPQLFRANKLTEAEITCW